jgi:tetratricopeptide (TPR) repeat protein
MPPPSAPRTADGYALVRGEPGALRPVRGRPFAAAIADYHRAPGRLAFHDLLRPFVAACQEVAFAHSLGKVHPGLTPYHILLGDFGDTGVIGWERPRGESAAAGNGSPARPPDEGRALPYLSPERATGGAAVGSPADDVYALGAVLYELLAGRPPHQGGSGAEVLARVKDGLPWPPSMVARKVPAALEGVCMRALDPDPAYRYRSAADLARDVERWLAGARVGADPQPLRTGLFAWVRRDLVRGGLAALAVLLAAGLAACAAVILLQRRQIDEVGEANLHLQRQIDEAKDRLQTANNYVNQVNRQRVQSALEFQQAVGALTGLVASLRRDDPASVALKRELLGTAQLLALQVDQAGGSDRLAAGDHLRLAELFLQLGQAEEARRRCERAVEITRPPAQAQPENLLAQSDLLEAAEKLALTDIRLGQLRAARDAYTLALSAAGTRARFSPQDVTPRRAVAVCFGQIGTLSLRLHDWAAARDAFKWMQATVEGNAAAFGDPLQTNFELVDVYALRGETEQNDHQYQEALAWYGRALAILRPLEKDGKLKGRPQEGQRQALERAEEECRASLRAVDDLGFALAQPPEKAERLLAGRAAVLARRGRPAAAAATAEKLRALKPNDGPNLYNVACCLALCAPAVAPGKAADALTAEEKAARAAYAGRAVRALREAVAHGFKDLTLLEIDPDLATLRPEAGYRAVVNELKVWRAGLTFPVLP